MNKKKTTIAETNVQSFAEIANPLKKSTVLNVYVFTHSANNKKTQLENALVEAYENGAVSVTVPLDFATQTITIDVIEKTGDNRIPIKGKPVELCTEDKTMRREVKRTNNNGNVTFEYAAKYTIRFNANGGIGAMKDQTFKIEGQLRTLAPNKFTKAGACHVFDRWNTCPDGSGTSFADKQQFQDMGAPNEIITLYAIWVSEFWLAPAKTDLENYKHPAYNILKYDNELLEDIKKLKSNTSATKNTEAEYTKYLNSDKVHLYTKIGTGINECDYAEFRIVQVGDPQKKAVCKGDIALTFQATHALEDGHCMSKVNTNEGGWADSLLRHKLQEGGEIYKMFPALLTQNLATVTNRSTTSKSNDSTIVETQDKMWLMSVSEIVGDLGSIISYQTADAARCAQYRFWKNALNEQVSTNFLLQNLIHTRQNSRFAHCEQLSANVETAGMLPLFESERAHNTTRNAAWLRTTVKNNEILFHTLEPTGIKPNEHIGMWSPILNAAVVPCFAI